MKNQNIHIYLYTDNMVIEGRGTPNGIVTFNFWREHMVIVVDPDRSRHFRLDIINQEQLLALNDT